MEDFCIWIVDLVECLEREFSPEVRSLRHHHPEDFYISMPALLIGKFVEGIKSKYAQGSGVANITLKDFHFRGLKVIPSHEMKIAIYHKDFPLIKDAKIISQLDFSESDLAFVNTDVGIHPDLFSYLHLS